MPSNVISLLTDTIISKFVWLIPIIAMLYLFEKSRFGGIYLSKLEKKKLLYLTDRYKKSKLPKAESAL